jgi:hypothetical protein
MSATRTLYPYQIDWYVRLADCCETTHDSWTVRCCECDDGCRSAYRMNGKPINPRAGRSTYLEEKLNAVDQAVEGGEGG